mgnify:CR=1 FL=1
MKRRMNKRMATAALAGAMVLSMNGMSAFAAVTEFNLTKEVTTDGNTHAPNTAFSFTIEEGNASTFEGAVVSAGVKDGLTLDTANNFSFAPGDEVSASYTKTGKIKVDATKFTEPGVYHYLVTETKGTYNGVTYDVTPRHVCVYVVNGTDGYEVEAVKVVKDGEKDKADDLKIVNIYGDSTPDDDIHDFIIKKTVTGNQGNKNKEFSFTVTIDGDDTDKAGKEKYKAVKTPKTGDPEIMHITDEEAATFTLMDGETLHIYGLSENDEYTVTEASYADDGYTTTIDNVKTSTTAGTIATGAGTTADNGDKNITVVNDKTTDSPTGIFLHIAPYIALIGAAIASSLLFFRRKRVKDMDID